MERCHRKHLRQRDGTVFCPPRKNASTREIPIPERPGRLSPDLVLLDLHLPDGDGLDVARWLFNTKRHALVVVISAHLDADRCIALRRAGVFMWLPKPIHFDALTNLLDDVDELRRAPRAAVPLGSCEAAGPWRLSRREIAVLQSTLRGYSQKEIGAQLKISPSTVRTHWNRIRDKAHECGADADSMARLAETLRRIYAAAPYELQSSGRQPMDGGSRE